MYVLYVSLIVSVVNFNFHTARDFIFFMHNQMTDPFQITTMKVKNLTLTVVFMLKYCIILNSPSHIFIQERMICTVLNLPFILFCYIILYKGLYSPSFKFPQ